MFSTRTLHLKMAVPDDQGYKKDTRWEHISSVSSVPFPSQVSTTMPSRKLWCAVSAHVSVESHKVVPICYRQSLSKSCRSRCECTLRCKSFYSMSAISIIKWAAKRAIGCRNVFANCHKIALSALLAVPSFLWTHPHNCQNSSESAHLMTLAHTWGRLSACTKAH